MLDLVLKLLPEDSKECQTARVLLYKLFYDQTDEGLTQFLLNRFKHFDSHKQPRSDLADLLEIIHIMLRLIEKLQAYGTLRVSKKIRRRKVRNKAPKDKIEVESELIEESEIAHENIESVSEMCVDPDKPVEEKLLELNSVEREQGFNHDVSSNLRPEVVLDKPLQNIEYLHDHSSAEQDDKEIEKQADQEYETSSSSNTEEPTTNEVNFNISALVSSFASSTIIHNLCWLMKHYKTNSASTNHYILCMLKRLCDDLELSPMLYQLSLLTVFYDILAEQKRCNSREYMNIVNFLKKFIRNMFKMLKSQPLLFAEMLFWKTRRECQFINAEVLMKNIDNLRQDVRNMACDSTVELNHNRDIGYRSIADALGEDEIDFDLPQMHHEQSAEQSSDVIDDGDTVGTKQSKVNKTTAAYTSGNNKERDASEIPSLSPRAPGTSSRDNSSNFSQDQDAIIKEFYEKYKNKRQCNLLIAEALGPDGKMSPALVSRKLKQLGLKVAPRKKLVKANVPFPAISDPTVSGSAVNATAQHGFSNSGNALVSKNLRRKQKPSFSVEEELQITILYEKFKDHRKRNLMIANALNPEKKFTATQVSRKLKQLGLLLHSKKSGKHMEDNEFNEKKENSDDEKLLAFRERSKRKKRVLGFHATATSTSPQQEAIHEENDSDDVVLSSLFKNAAAKHKIKHSREGQEAAYSETRVTNSTAIGNDRGDHDPISALHQNIEVEKHSELEDLMDLGDDVVPMPSRNVGSRKRMLLVFEDED